MYPKVKHSNRGTESRVEFAFEALEPRLLLSADFIPIDGRIDLPGETDAYVITLNQEALLHVDSRLAAPVRWSLLDAEQTVLGSATEASTNGRTATAPRAIPLAAGTYRFSVEGVGDATGDYLFQLKDLNAAPVVDFAATDSAERITGTLEHPRQSVAFGFDISSGQGISISIDDAATSVVGALILLSPGGHEIHRGAVVDFALSGLLESGRHTLLLESNGTGGVDYALDLARPADTPVLELDGTETPLALDTDVTAEITAPGQVLRYAVTLDEPGLVVFDARSRVVELNWRLSASTGAVAQPSLSFANASSDTRALMLPKGTHLLEISGTGGFTGTGRFALLSAASATALPEGAEVQVQQDPSGAAQLWHFDAEAGTVVGLRETAASAAANTQYTLFGPGGAVLATRSDGLARTVLPVSGRHYVMLNERNFTDAPVDIAFRFDRVADPAPQAIGFDAPVNGTLSTTGARHVYTFTLDSQERIFVDWLAADSTIRGQLVGPQGTVWTGHNPNGAAGALRGTVLGPGSYRLEVTATTVETGSYAVQLLRASDATEIELDAEVEITIPETGGSRLFHVPVPAGTQVHARYLGGATGLPIYWAAHDAAETIIPQRLIGSATAPALARDGGIWFSFGRTLSAGGAFSAGFQFVQTTDTRATLALDSLAEADFTAAPGRARFDLTLTEDTTVFFNAQTTASQVRWEIGTPDGFTVASGTANATGFGNRHQLAAGDYLVTVTATSDIRQSVPFRIVDLGQATALERDTDVTVTLDPAGSVAALSLDVVAGEALFFDIAASSAQARLIAPSGQGLWSSAGPVDTRSYMEGGRYTLILEGSNSSAGSVRVAVRAPQSDVVPIDMGAAVTGTILRGDAPGHAFSLTSDRLVAFDSLTPLSGLRWWIETPDGAQITSARAFNSQSGGYEAAHLLSAGEYVLRVTGQNAATGDYGFRLLDSADAQPIAPDTPVAVTLEAGRESRLFAFDALAGERLAVAAPEIDGASRGNLSWRIVHESGLEVARRNSFQPLDSETLHLSGRYFLILDGGSNLSAPVDLTFQLARSAQPTAPLQGADFAPGTLVEGQIAAAGDVAHHRFTLTERTRLIFDSRTNSSALRWQIDGAHGAITASRAFNTTGFSAYGGVWTGDNPFFITLDPGDYHVRVSATGTATGSYGFALLDLDAGADLTGGDAVTQPVFGTAMAAFRLEAQAGDSAWVRTASPGLSTLSTRWQLLAPDGSRLSANLGGGNWDLPLHVTGTHYITFEPGLTVTGPYDIEASAGVHQTTRFDIAPGDAALRTLPPGHTHRHLFEMDAPGVLFLDARTSAQAIEWWLERDGEIVHPARDLRSTLLGTHGRLVLAPGVYELVIKGRSGAEGDYAFALRDLDADLPVLGPEATAFTLDPASGSAAYTFDGTAGSEVFIAGGTASGPAPNWSLFGPGMLLIAEGLLSSHPGRFLLPQDGAYRLVLDGQPTATGSANGTLQITATGDVVQPLPLDTDVTGTLAHPGERQIHAFTLTAPTRLFFDSLTNRNDLRWTLEGPDGVLRTAGLNNDSSGSEIHASGPGAYRLIIEGDGTATGTYRFRMLDLDRAARIAPGQHVAGVLDPGSRARAFLVAGATGERLFLDSTAPAGQNAWWRLFAPTGDLLAQGSTQADISGVTLGLDGDYLLTIEGANSRTDPALYAFNLFLHPGAAQAGATPLQGSTPAPDLVVRDMAASAAGPVQAGQPVQLQWTTRNAGDAMAAGSFSERIVLRNLDLDLVLMVLELPHDGPALAAGAERARSVMLDLPSGAAGAGQLEFSVETDIRRQIAEISADGRAEANNRTRLGVTALPDTLPDLIVTDVALDPAADWQPGDTVTVRWTTRNTGEAAAVGPWREQLRIRNIATNAEVTLQTLDFAGTLAPGEAAVRSLELVWPEGTIATGLYRVTVTTDVADDVPEANADGTAESNNATSLDQVSAPDLVVAALSLSDPAPVSGQPVTLNWTLRNDGNIATRGDFTDWLWILNQTTGTVILSEAVPYDADALGGIPPGGTAARSFTFTLPEGAAGAGTLDIRVITNRDTSNRTGIIEAGPTGAAYDNNTRRITVTAELAADPDLAALEFNTPASAEAGSAITLFWRATNAGGALAPGGWIDRVQLRRADGSGAPLTLLEVPRTADLPAGAEYQISRDVTLPEALSGAWELVLTLDAEAALNEPGARDNNVLHQALTLTAPAADLLAEVITGPATALAGGDVTLTWRVVNTGEAAASGTWSDALWLSPTPALSAQATLLAEVPRTLPLAPDEGYTGQASVTLPADMDGDLFFVLETDTGQVVFEAGRRDNNLVASPLPVTVALPTAANLRPVRLEVPENAVPGEALRIGWQVENAGAGVARAPWADRVVLVSEDTGAQTVLGSVARTFDLAPGAAYDAYLDVTLPALGSGAWRVAVITDWQNRVFEGAATDDNRLEAETTLGIARPDLAPVITAAPGAVISGQEITVEWRVENRGAGQALAGFADELWLTRSGQVDDDAVLLDRSLRDTPLDPGAAWLRSVTGLVPIALSGDWQLLVRSDADGVLVEADTDNNSATAPLTITLAEHADLAVSDVVAPPVTARDPAMITVGWTVTNIGSGQGAETGWVDRIIASRSGVPGAADNITLAEVARTAPLAPGESYTAFADILMPPRFSDRLTLFVLADAENTVFEAGLTDNNLASPPHPVDIMPAPNADLIVTGFDADPTGQSGQSLALSWSVANVGPGVTDRNGWTDRIRIFADDAATQLVATRDLTRIGALAPGESYTRSAQITLPEGLSGRYWLQLETAPQGTQRPFEFIFDDNNRSALAPVDVTLAPSADLQVGDIALPDTAIEGSAIDIAWQVTNAGAATAAGGWVDRVVLVPQGQDAAPVVLGDFNAAGPLAAGLSYQRTEQVVLPARLVGAWQIQVITNASRTVYEHGPLAENNSRTSARTLTVTPLPRPNLQVAAITAPDTVDAGGTLQVEFEVINQGAVAATGTWIDRVYLSASPQLGAGAILLGTFANGAALAPGARYATTTQPVEVPLRFGGDAWVIVVTDAGNAVDEFPFEDDNTARQQLFVTPAPRPDLVLERVVAPQQAVAGAEIEVRFTVANHGLGETFVGSWQDSIWIARDPRRPNAAPAPQNPGDIDFVRGNSAQLLATIPRSGVLAVGESYEVIARVRLPDTLESGRYYITPWADSTGLVIEDTLAININPDDPDELDNNNYKGRAIDILGQVISLPDLVPQVIADATAPVRAGQDRLEVTWQVRNDGAGNTPSGARWLDGVYLSDSPEWGAPGAQVITLALEPHLDGLGRGESYTRSRSFDLPPSAAGQYVHVRADVVMQGWPGVTEADEDNNTATTPVMVTRAASNLRLLGLEAPVSATSSGRISASWQVENTGADVWDGTEQWFDALWVSPDPVPDFSRATLLAVVPVRPEGGLPSGGSYAAQADVTLPGGIEGPYYLHVFSNVSSISGRPFDSDSTTGAADSLRSIYRNRVFEADAFADNRASRQIDVTYSEPNLVVSAIDLPAEAMAGTEIELRFTVANIGTRDTTVGNWMDRVFLSRDGALDAGDTMLAEVRRIAPLAAGDSYEATVMIRLPDGIEGDFNIIVDTDSLATPLARAESDIRSGLSGLRLGTGQGRVPEFRDTGDNQSAAPLTITRGITPDLRITAIDIPEALQSGQRLPVSFTITNLGEADTRDDARWTDAVYLSRDTTLDPRNDIFLGQFQRVGGLAVGEGYTVTADLDPRRLLDGAWYVVVRTDLPDAANPDGRVFEGAGEGNNIRATAQPVLFGQAPPADLVASDVRIEGTLTSGNQVTLRWTVTNASDSPAQGRWTDAVYLSTDSTWDIGDRLLGRLERPAELAPGESYEAELIVNLPPVTEGFYRFIVRADIRNEVFEDGATGNNIAVSASAVHVDVPELSLNTPTALTLAPGQERLFRVTPGAAETLQIALQSDQAEARNALFLRAGTAPDDTRHDATHRGPARADPVAVLGNTVAGAHYVLVRALPGGDTVQQLTLTPRLLPLSITDLSLDRGGDGRFVTLAVEGARFAPDAVLRLTRPGVAAFEPERIEVSRGTTITAVFDLLDAPRGLYDIEVINPDGSMAVAPYRYLIERRIEAQVQMALGGPRVVEVGAAGTYSVSFANFGNTDAPYVHFTFGVPEMGTAPGVWNLPFLELATNVTGAPSGDARGIDWAVADPLVNRAGQILAPGFVHSIPAGGVVQATFNAQTYPALQALVERDFAALRAFLYARDPALRAAGALDGGPSALEDLNPLWAAIFNDPRVEVIDDAVRLYAPFQFNVVAAATPMTHAEFLAFQTAQAQSLRAAILADETAPPALMTLAADEPLWLAGYLAALEDAGILRAAEDAPYVRDLGAVTSLVSTLSMGLVLGPEGDALRSSGDLVEFFAQVRQWYGTDSDTLAPLAGLDLRERLPDILPLDIPVPQLPVFEDYALGLANPTQFLAFNVFSAFGAAEGFDVGAALSSGALDPLDLGRYLQEADTLGRTAALIGPRTGGDGTFVPAGTPLPYEIRVEAPQAASGPATELRIVTALDPALDPGSFRLGAIMVDGVTITVPPDRQLFQTELNLEGTRGVVVRVSAGVDAASGIATWLIEAIDPATGEPPRDGLRGLFADADGTAQVFYTVQPRASAPDGAEITASARVFFDNAPPEATNTLTQRLDAQPPRTTLEVTRVPGSAIHALDWVADDEGAGVRDVALYVATDGGDFRLFDRFGPSGFFSFQGESGRSYEFLALARDLAGNVEPPPLGVSVPGSAVLADLGGPGMLLPTPAAPAPTPPPPADATPHPLFVAASGRVPAPVASANPSSLTQVLAPFAAAGFVSGLPAADAAGLGATALAQAPDGSVIVAGGMGRGALYRVAPTGGPAPLPFAMLDTPIHDLAFGRDGRLWAANGAELLELDPDSGMILARHGTGLTQALAVDPASGVIFITSGRGIERFDPVAETFAPFSETRAGSLAFGPDGQLWAAAWPERGAILRLDAQGQASQMLQLPGPVDSLSLGLQAQEGLLFASSNRGADGRSALYLVDMATRDWLVLGQSAERGDNLLTLADGRVLSVQGAQVDVLNPVTAPAVSAITPALSQIITTPLRSIIVQFDSDMLTGTGTEPGSVLNPDNYRIANRQGQQIPVTGVVWDPATRSATLSVDPLTTEEYLIAIARQVSNEAGVQMAQRVESRFAVLLDFSDRVALEFTNVRSSAQDGTLRYDVRITNISDAPLPVPLRLVLDPDRAFGGTAIGAEQAGDLWLLDLSGDLPASGTLAPGAAVTTTPVLALPRGSQIGIDHALFSLPMPNSPPELTAPLPERAVVGETLSTRLQAVDPDGTSPVFVLLDAPEGLELSRDGLLTFTPTAATAESVQMRLRIYDGFGAWREVLHQIGVDGGNHPPRFLIAPDTVLAVEGMPLAQPFAAYDPDGEAVFLRFENLPMGAYWDAQQGALVWQPDYGQAGSYADVRLIATDGRGETVHRFDILVAEGAAPPLVAPPAERVIREGETLRVQLVASDPRGAPLRFGSPALPSGGRLDAQSGLFEWTPDFTDAGRYRIPFVISNGQRSTQVHLEVEVLNVNAPPVFAPLDELTLFEGQPLDLALWAIDPDNPRYAPPVRIDGVAVPDEDRFIAPTLTYTVSGLPEGAVFDPETARLHWIPDFGQAGRYSLAVTATDDGDGTGQPASTTQTVALHVLNLNRPPELAPIGNRTVAAGAALEIPVTATDPDGNPLRLSALLTPAPGSGATGLDLRPRALTAEGDGLGQFIDNGDGTGLLRFAPVPFDRGNHVITVQVEDDGGGAPALISRDEVSFVLTVEAPSIPPRLTIMPQAVAVVGRELVVPLDATDPDQDPLTFSADTLPPGARIEPLAQYGRAVLVWTPGPDDTGVHDLVITVRDNGNDGAGPVGTDQAPLRLVVRAANAAPLLLPVGPQQVDARQTLDLQLAAIDPDDDLLTFTARNLPPGAVLDRATGRLRWTPPPDAAGIYEGIELRVTDGADDSLETISITVNAVNRAPVLVPLPMQFGREGTETRFQLIAADPDGDPVVFEARDPLPRGAEFDTTSGSFRWTPGFDAAGTYQLAFAALDPSGAEALTTVALDIADVNRAPVLAAANQIAILGE